MNITLCSLQVMRRDVMVFLMHQHPTQNASLLFDLFTSKKFKKYIKTSIKCTNIGRVKFKDLLLYLSQAGEREAWLWLTTCFKEIIMYSRKVFLFFRYSIKTSSLYSLFAQHSRQLLSLDS